MNKNEKEMELNENQLNDVNGGVNGLAIAGGVTAIAGAGVAIASAFVDDKDAKTAMQLAGGAVGAIGGAMAVGAAFKNNGGNGAAPQTNTVVNPEPDFNSSSYQNYID